MLVVGELTFALNALDEVVHVGLVLEEPSDLPSSWSVLCVEDDSRFHDCRGIEGCVTLTRWGEPYCSTPCE